MGKVNFFYLFFKLLKTFFIFAVINIMYYG